MHTHEGTVGIAPAMTAIAVVAAIGGSLWWNTREEPQALPPASLQPVATESRPAAPERGGDESLRPPEEGSRDHNRA